MLIAGSGRLSPDLLTHCFLSGARTTGMILLIVPAAFVLNLALSLTGVGEALTQWVTGIGLSQWQMLVALIGFYLVPGMFMDTLSMMFATIPLSFPVATSLGVAAGEHVTRGPGAGRAARARPAALSRPRA